MTAALYARAGEDVVCEAGHVVTRPTRDLRCGEVVFGDMLEGMAHLRPGDAAAGVPGDAFPLCPCGERWFWHGAIRFRDGYRAVVDGEPVHLSLDQVSAGWREISLDRAVDQALSEIRP